MLVLDADAWHRTVLVPVVRVVLQSFELTYGRDSTWVESKSDPGLGVFWEAMKWF
jgi:hypothetical protein